MDRGKIADVILAEEAADARTPSAFAAGGFGASACDR
jgi:hypothetical protein